MGAIGPRAYDPLEPVEPEPWSGGVGFGVDDPEPELDGPAEAGDTGFGGVWLAGAAGAVERGAIGDVPACAGAWEGAVGPEGGGVAETGRGGAGGGAKGLGAGAGIAATGFGGGGAAGRGAGAGAAAIGFGGGGAAGLGAGIAAIGCLGTVF